MKKTYVAALGITAAFIIALAAAVVYLQNQSPTAGSESGQLVVMGTDPPVTATGVTDSSIHYNSVSAHRAGSDMSSGWTQLGGSGELDLMATQGSAQTMATSQVGAGVYDAFRFNVDSAKVTYQGHDYVATVATTSLTAQSQSKVQVNGSDRAAAIMDLRTFIMNTGNSSNPQFIFSATAVATAIPPQALLSVSLTLGSSSDLSGQAWWTSFASQTSTKVEITAQLTTNALALTLHNTGDADAEVHEVIVTPVASSSTSTSLPSSFEGSAVFTVDGSGSLQQTTSLQSTAFLNGGAGLNSGSSADLTYTGNISLNYGSVNLHIGAILPGQQYMVTVIGSNTYASALVVAS